MTIQFLFFLSWRDAIVLFSMVSSSLRLLFRGVSHFPGFPSIPCFLLRNPCFLSQNPVLPWFLRAVLRRVRGNGGGGGGSLGGLEASLALYVFLSGCAVYPANPIPDPSPDPITAGDWGAELRE